MTNEIIKILNDLQKENDCIKECDNFIIKSSLLNDVKRIDLEGIHISEDNTRDKITIAVKEDLKAEILKVIYNYYSCKKQEHEKNMDDLVIHLQSLDVKNTPPDAATSNGVR